MLINDMKVNTNHFIIEKAQGNQDKSSNFKSILSEKNSYKKENDSLVTKSGMKNKENSKKDIKETHGEEEITKEELGNINISAVVEMLSDILKLHEFIDLENIDIIYEKLIGSEEFMDLSNSMILKDVFLYDPASYEEFMDYIDEENIGNLLKDLGEADYSVNTKDIGLDKEIISENQMNNNEVQNLSNEENKFVKNINLENQTKSDLDNLEEGLSINTHSEEAVEIKVNTRYDKDFSNEENLEEDNESSEIIIPNVDLQKSRQVEFKEPIDDKTEIIINEKDIIKQVTDKVIFDLSKDVKEIKLSLKPRTLGDVNINLEVVNGEVVAKAFVESYKTKQILENNITMLQKELEDTGMEIKTFEVFVGSNNDYEQQSDQNKFNFFNKRKNNKLNKSNSKSISIVSNNYESGTILDENKSIYIDGQSMDLQA